MLQRGPSRPRPPLREMVEIIVERRGALFFIGISMAGDFYVVLTIVTGAQAIAILCPIVALGSAFALWFGFPLAARRRVRSIA